MTPGNRARRYAAESVGAFCLVFAGTGACVVNELKPGSLGVLGVAVVFGLIVMAMIAAVGRISGAHLNPAVTAAFWARGHFRGADVAPYVAAQCGGAVLASLTLKLLFGASRLGMTTPAGSFGQSFALELILTAILMFVVMGVSTDDKAQGQSAGLAVGAVVMLEAAFGGPISGASMNPARSFGPALLLWDFQAQWVYWLAPIGGALLGALLYERLSLSAKPN